MQKVTITEFTRRNIFDTLTAENVHWSGRMDNDAFLARIYDLESMPSTDSRFSGAARDIHQHTVLNYDWDRDWVYTDSRFNLFRCPDEEFLTFLCEMVHPVVRPEEEWVEWLVEMFNANLVADGWEISAVSELSGRPIFSGRRLLEGAGPSVKNAKNAAEILNATYISQQINRMEKAVGEDAELAIGTAKEFIETICKTILDKLDVEIVSSDDFPKLTKKVMKVLHLTPDGITNEGKITEILRRLLNNLGSVSFNLAELRNVAGSGHGKHAETVNLETRHARLAVAAASALGVFLFESFQQTSEKKL